MRRPIALFVIAAVSVAGGHALAETSTVSSPAVSSDVDTAVRASCPDGADPR